MYQISPQKDSAVTIMDNQHLLCCEKGYIQCQNNERTSMVIDGYIHQQQVAIPLDIEKQIHKLFIKYYWESKTVFECNENQMKDVIQISMKKISHKKSIDMNKMECSLEDDKINGNTFCSLTIKSKGLCSIGAAILSWKMIHRFDFTFIKPGSSIYLPLQ